MTWEQRWGRSKCTGSSAKEVRWGRGPSKLFTHGSHRSRNKGSQRPGTLVQIFGLHAYKLELVSVDLEHLWPFWSPWPPWGDSPCLYQSSPFWFFALDLWYYGLVFFSVVAECNITIKHLFCSLSWKKKKKKDQSFIKSWNQVCDLSQKTAASSPNLSYTVSHGLMSLLYFWPFLNSSIWW